MIYKGECTLNRILENKDSKYVDELKDKVSPFYIVSTGAIIGLESIKPYNTYCSTVIATKDLSLLYKMKYSQLYELTKTLIQNSLEPILEIQTININKAYDNLKISLMKKKMIKSNQLNHKTKIEYYEKEKSRTLANNTADLINEIRTTKTYIQYRPKLTKTKVYLKSLENPHIQMSYQDIKLEQNQTTFRTDEAITMNLHQKFKKNIERQYKLKSKHSINCLSNIATSTYSINTNLNTQNNSINKLNSTRNIGTSTDDIIHYSKSINIWKEKENIKERKTLHNQPFFHFNGKNQFRKPSYNTGYFSIPLMTICGPNPS